MTTKKLDLDLLLKRGFRVNAMHFRPVPGVLICIQGPLHVPSDKWRWWAIVSDASSSVAGSGDHENITDAANAALEWYRTLLPSNDTVASDGARFSACPVCNATNGDRDFVVDDSQSVVPVVICCRCGHTRERVL